MLQIDVMQVATIPCGCRLSYAGIWGAKAETFQNLPYTQVQVACIFPVTSCILGPEKQVNASMPDV
jgi:hypothetical protein